LFSTEHQAGRVIKTTKPETARADLCGGSRQGPSPLTHGTEMVVGGTGKFVGITGTGEWTQYIATPIKADDKAIRALCPSG
jgi:hypothetical protein